MKRLCVIFLLLLAGRCWAAEVIPPAPAAYFNDYANLVPSATASQLNHTLADFERQTSEQIIVAVFPKLESSSPVEDYAVRVFRAWGVGQKDKNNGAALFVFVQDHKIFLATGYGLEGALPDALCKRIIDEQITPRFKSGDFAGGLTAGVQSILAATKGEYRGTGQTVAQRQAYVSYGNQSVSGIGIVAIIFIALIVIAIVARLQTMFPPDVAYDSYGRRRYRSWDDSQNNNTGFLAALFAGSSSNDGGGGFSSGGGFSGGSSDSFSGGGGSSGGGGAGGSW